MRIVECKSANEQTHGEADAGEERCPVNLDPRCRRLAGGDAQPHHQPDRAEHARLRAQEKARDDGQRHRFDKLAETVDMDAGTCKSEQRHDAEHHPRVNRMFEALERRLVLSAPERDCQSGKHA